MLLLKRWSFADLLTNSVYSQTQLLQLGMIHLWCKAVVSQRVRLGVKVPVWGAETGRVPVSDNNPGGKGKRSVIPDTLTYKSLTGLCIARYNHPRDQDYSVYRGVYHR